MPIRVDRAPPLLWKRVQTSFVPRLCLISLPSKHRFYPVFQATKAHKISVCPYLTWSILDVDQVDICYRPDVYSEDGNSLHTNKYERTPSLISTWDLIQLHVSVSTTILFWSLGTRFVSRALAQDNAIIRSWEHSNFSRGNIVKSHFFIHLV